MIHWRVEGMAVSYFLTALENIIHVDRLVKGEVWLQLYSYILLFLEGVIKTV
jgi:hypothetical protein